MENERNVLIIDGKMIDIGKLSVEELEKLERDLKAKEKKIRESIDKELGRDLQDDDMDR